MTWVSDRSGSASSGSPAASAPRPRLRPRSRTGRAAGGWPRRRFRRRITAGSREPASGHRRHRRAQPATSESSRKLALTNHPLARSDRPVGQRALPSPRQRTSTARGSKRPGAVSTKTIWRRPLVDHRESGTTRPSPKGSSCSTSTNMPGRSRSPGLGRSKRARSVRASGVELRVDVGDARGSTAGSGRRAGSGSPPGRRRRSGPPTRRSRLRPRGARGRPIV